MIESYNKKDVEDKIQKYVNGQLSAAEIEELWAELIQDEYHLDYLKSVANIKAVVEKEEEKSNVIQLRRYWSYAAAAVVAMLIAVLSILNYSELTTSSTVKPVSKIELDYYRSAEGVLNNNKDSRIILDAIKLANKGKFEEAVSLLKNELRQAQDPKWISEINLNLGSLYYNNGNYDQAISYYTDIIDYKDDINVLTLEKAYWYLGNTYFQLDELDKAKSNIQKAYALNGAYRRVARSYLDALSE